MSQFVVSARKYRPQRFEDVVGQEHVSKTLKNALQSQHLAQAFLFCGPRGVGKTTCARILAKTLNCRQLTPQLEPCNECDSCTAFNENASFNITELDAASNNSVDHIRSLIDQVRFQPQQGKYKVFIIDEVHMLSASAFNAFLKTLEEPPPYAIFILATTEKHKIIPTILSRCQIFDFRRIQIPDIVAHLTNICSQEGIQAEPDALHIIAQKADGGLRDALSIFDRIVSFAGRRVTYEDVIANLNILDYDYFFRITDALLTEDIPQTLAVFDDVIRKGFDADLFVNGLAEHLRNLLVCKDEQTLALLEAGDSLRERYRQQARLSPMAFLLTSLNLANDCDINFKMARNKRLHAEMSLLRMASIGRARRIDLSGDTEKKNPERIANEPTGSPEPSQAQQPATTASIPASIPVSAMPVEQVATAPSTTTVPKAHVLPKIDLHSILSEVAEARDTGPAKTRLTSEEVQQAWNNYAATVTQEIVRLQLKSARLEVDALRVTAYVGSKLAESTLREDSALMDSLRQQLQTDSISLQIVIDESMRSVDKTPQIKILTPREKYIQLREINPDLEQMFKRFDLQFDEE
jgi:DNA polymerase-3 subunit gamma/tau